MIAIVGYIIVFGGILGGFVVAGGHPAALVQPSEFIIIGGAAVGAFLVGNSGAPLKMILKDVPKLFKGSSVNKALYMELFALLYEILGKVRKEGLMSIETDVDAPHESALLTKYPTVLHQHHAIEFMCDYLRLMVGGNLNPVEIENLMDVEIEVHHNEGHTSISALNNFADSFPAYGIVAAVMGVVHVMDLVGKVSPSELGVAIGAALVGTFLGIAIGYGIISPIYVNLTHKLNDQTRLMNAIKVTLLASLNGYAPPVSVEFGRKALQSLDRPSFLELEEYVKNSKNR